MSCSKDICSQETLIYHIVRSACFVVGEFAWFLAKFLMQTTADYEAKYCPSVVNSGPWKSGQVDCFIFDVNSIKFRDCNINMARIANAVPYHVVFELYLHLHCICICVGGRALYILREGTSGCLFWSLLRARAASRLHNRAIATSTRQWHQPQERPPGAGWLSGLSMELPEYDHDMRKLRHQPGNDISRKKGLQGLAGSLDSS